MSKKYRVRTKRVYEGTRCIKIPTYHNDYYYEEVPSYTVMYEVLKWNRVVKTYSNKAAATRLKNRLEKEDE